MFKGRGTAGAFAGSSPITQPRRRGPFLVGAAWSFVVRSSRGNAMQWINIPCSSGGCRPGGWAGYVQCLRAAPAGAVELCRRYRVSGPTTSSSRQCQWSPASSIPNRSQASSTPVPGTTSSREEERQHPGALHVDLASGKNRSWSVTRTGVPALLYGNHGIPASFDSMQLISVGPPSNSLSNRSALRSRAMHSRKSSDERSQA